MFCLICQMIQYCCLDIWKLLLSAQKKGEIHLYKILLKNIEKKYEYDELIRVFLRPDQFESFTETEYAEKKPSAGEFIIINEEGCTEKNMIKREIFRKLLPLTDQTPPAWGILTGVRPVKLTGELFARLGTEEAVRKELREFYFVNEEKTQLLFLNIFLFSIT